MEPIESSETSAYNNTLTPGTYPKEKKWILCDLTKVSYYVNPDMSLSKLNFY